MLSMDSGNSKHKPWLLHVPTRVLLAMKLWLGIPLFDDTPSGVRCSCGHIMDVFGDHLLGCGHDGMRTRCHIALKDIV